MSYSMIFIPNFVCVLTNIKHIEQNFHSVAGVMPQGWYLGVLGESNTLAWGFAMGPHLLRAQIIFVVIRFITIIFL